jgi:hypothetical protein
MSDLNETPAVPETPTGGDERAGLYLAGGLLVAIGWGGAVLLNLLVHAAAPVGGVHLGPLVVYATWGAYAQATALIGLLTGGVGAGILYTAGSAPTGPLVLPGYEY